MKWIISEDKLSQEQINIVNAVGINNTPIYITGTFGSGVETTLIYTICKYLKQFPNSNTCLVVSSSLQVESFRNAIEEIGLNALSIFTHYQLKNILDCSNRFDAIFCNEVNDLPIDFIIQIKDSCKHLVLAGDAMPSVYLKEPIYKKEPTSFCDINEIIQPIAFKLSWTYNINNSLRSILINGIQENELIGKSPKQYEDCSVMLFESPSILDEIEFCWNDANKSMQLRHESFAILLADDIELINFINVVLTIEKKPNWIRANKNGLPDYDLLNIHLHINNIPIIVKSGEIQLPCIDKEENKIIVMTYLSSRGLVFNNVYLPLVGNNLSLYNNDIRINTLYAIALSRTDSRLLITYTGATNEHITPFMKSIVSKPIGTDRTNLDFKF
jgi:hypothetical protein